MSEQFVWGQPAGSSSNAHSLSISTVTQTSPENSAATDSISSDAFKQLVDNIFLSGLSDTSDDNLKRFLQYELQCEIDKLVSNVYSQNGVPLDYILQTLRSFNDRLSALSEAAILSDYMNKEKKPEKPKKGFFSTIMHFAPMAIVIMVGIIVWKQFKL